MRQTDPRKNRTQVQATLSSRARDTAGVLEAIQLQPHQIETGEKLAVSMYASYWCRVIDYPDRSTCRGVHVHMCLDLIAIVSLQSAQHSRDKALHTTILHKYQD